MILIEIKLILEIILIALEIVILVKSNFLKPKKHKKNRSNHRKDER
ncbi:MAG: hypothetical protein IJU86_01165 [Firmicutes bacterium]|nr:hypothetical protein [Bacillota bacterium]